MTDYEHLLVKQDGDTVRITMNRPQRRNSLTEGHLRELLDAFESAGRSDATGIVLAGEGKAFSSGHDFGDVAARDLAGVRSLLRLCTTVMRTVQEVPQVVIARVHATAWAAGSLGELGRRRDAVVREHFRLLRAARLVDDDIAADEQIHAWGAVTWGYFLAEGTGSAFAPAGPARTAALIEHGLARQLAGPAPASRAADLAGEVAALYRPLVAHIDDEWRRRVR